TRMPILLLASGSFAAAPRRVPRSSTLLPQPRGPIPSVVPSSGSISHHAGSNPGATEAGATTIRPAETASAIRALASAGREPAPGDARKTDQGPVASERRANNTAVL